MRSIVFGLVARHIFSRNLAISRTSKLSGLIDGSSHLTRRATTGDTARRAPRASNDGPRSFVHWFALTCVAITFAISGFVFAEPAPVDVMALGLVVLLPIVGLTHISRGLVVYLALWLVVAAGHFLASAVAVDVGSAARFSGVSLYLYFASFVVAAFVARRTELHTKLILNAWTFAAVLATVLGLAGYAGLFPGAESMFTKFGRVAGTFKDPNVFGAFLVTPVVYMLHQVIAKPATRALVPLGTAGFLSIGVLLCFSRGAWMNLAIAVVLYGYLAFVTAPNLLQRARITSYLGVGIVVGIATIAVAVQFDPVWELLRERASFVQSYDTGHEGRFGGQLKSIGLIAENPAGIGANAFGMRYHHEEVHNVYLSIVLNSGWLGGGVYWIVVGLTIALGFRHCLQASASRPLFLVVYTSFVATAIEGLIIDTDHWRHFFTLMALCWGMMYAREVVAASARIVAEPSRWPLRAARLAVARQ